MPPDTHQQDERTRLLSPQNDVESNTQYCERGDQAEVTWREWTGLQLESPAVHRLVISLIILDSIFVLIDLSYTFLIQPCATPGNPEEDAPVWLEILSHISLGITTLFLIEIPLAVWAFGFGFYNPTVTRAGGWHILDATVIAGTFTLEVILRGKERELASLLILLRLWRLVKLVGGKPRPIVKQFTSNLVSLQV
jgi:voltage-gated hydrogen channel 1